ncbi:MAG: hypothetical protein F4110_11865 [Acidimicrobiaceae bacterium]|nr:hypothetical protein [Acidimicrobiaceae bacterium]MXZ98038.1 hypothetical protein [Acidimicrobiaceae bacterium]MYE76429.1 hypothetical protein [Acidimicrobiaceae bacterium]MYE98297.1 hypothetical protein [Acidimicrobiaceae bacterium]MYH42309.1 hypothetical protein [Acidimicrobiaceae bacterium]
MAVAGAFMLTCCSGEGAVGPNAATTSSRSDGPVLWVNNRPLNPFYTEQQPPQSGVEFGDIATLPTTDHLETVLLDGRGGWRTIDLRFYDQYPTDSAERVAEVSCSNIDHTLDELPLFELPTNVSVGPVRLLECTNTDNDAMRVVVDIGGLEGGVLYVVVPVIWWPATEAADFMTASWVFMMPPPSDADL